jgi:hypothetical protein
MIRRFNRRIGSKWTVSIQPTDTDDTPIGRPTVYQGVLRSVQHPNTDRNSGDTAMVAVILHAFSVA